MIDLPDRRATPPHRRAIQVHLTLADGRALSLFAAVERLSIEPGAHVLRSSITDVDRLRCATRVIGEPRVPAVLRARLDRDPGAHHPLVRRALHEVLATGRLPYPDATADATATATAIWALDGDQWTAGTDGGVELRLAYPDDAIVCAVTLTPQTPAVAGDDALLSTWHPRCEVTGTITLGGETHAIAHGVGTCFEIGDAPRHDRAVIHLDDGRTLHVTAGASPARAVVVAADGASVAYVDVVVEPIDRWTSLSSFHDFAIAWRLAIPAAGVDLVLRAAFANQELVTVTARDPLWCGRCHVTGTVAGAPVAGVAYVEHQARDAAATLPEFFAAVPRATLGVIHRQLPLPLAPEDVRAMLGGAAVDRYVRDVDLGEFQRILIQPIREILDRQGKAWRSYTAVVCFYALRGDRWRQDVVDVLLGLAEVIHVGSLIVDDVEDASPTRRGGPACHVAHGVPIAINAGTFCYFVWQAWFARLELPAAAKLQIYEIYFEFMRVAHLGQALDLQGVPVGLADDVVETGDVTRLARQLTSVYLLKTGAPASVFARIGAIVAGGGAAQVRALGELFEAIGIAFQIMDDVQNLRGFVGDAKHGEDLAQAKLTMPVLEAMRVLDLPARRALWAQIGRCGAEPTLVPSIIDTLEQCGAFTACRDQAHVLLDDAWQRAAPLLEDSVAKLMLRSFCLYVVECLG
mgnify:CR=1 FL=1